MRAPAPTALALAATLLAPAAAAQDWTNLGGNAARNGLSPVQGPLAASVAWSNTDDFSVIAWAPFTEGARVFTVRESGFPANGGAANDALVALDLASGAELWRTTLPFGGDTSVEWIAWLGGVRDGRLYASRSSHLKPGPLRAYDAATGAPLWTSTAQTEAFAYDGVVFAPDGDPIVGDWQQLVRIDAATGATVWSTPRNRAVSGNCGAAATDTAVFIDEVAPGGQVVTKLDLATGAVLYSGPVMSGFTAQNAPFLSPDGQTVYFSRTQNNPGTDFLFAFQDTGTSLVQLWSREVRWTTSHEHGIAADGSIYTFLPGDEFVRLDPATGAVSASAGVLTPTGSPNLSPKTAVGADGTVYVSNGWASNPATDGRLWAFPADLSTQLFVLSLDRQNQGGPALAQDGTLLVCDRLGVHAWRDGGPGVVLCAGDGTASACPCGNTGAPGHGCGNGTFAGGALLEAQGQASVTADTVALSCADATPNQPGLFFQGNVTLNGGLGQPFGDGLRCAGVNVIRLETVFADGGGAASSSVGIAALAGLAAGDQRSYQFWYRDPALSPCGALFNLSNGYQVVWQP